MADAQVRVETVWDLHDRLTGPLTRMTAATNQLARVTEFAKGQMMALAGAAGIGLGVSGVISFVKGLVSANSQLEEMRLNLGGTLWSIQQMGLASFGLSNFNAALERGGRLYEELERHAAKAVGTTEDYAQAWHAVAQPMFHAGASLEDTLTVAKLLVPTARSLNIPLEVAAFSIKQALLGMVDARDMLVAQLGLQTQQVNQLARQGRQAEVLQQIMAALGKRAETAAAAGDLFSAKLATVQDILLHIRRTIGEELFKSLKGLADEFERWYRANEEGVRAWAREVGQNLVEALKTAVSAVKTIKDHWDEITAVVKALVEYWLATRLMQAIANATIAISAMAASITATTAAAQGAAVAGGAAVKGATVGGAAAAGAAGLVARILPWTTVAIAFYEGAKALGSAVEAENRRTVEWLSKSQNMMPWLYEEARRKAEGQAYGPDIWQWMARYIEEHWEAAVKAQQALQETAESLAQQSSEMAEFFGTTWGQSVPDAINEAAKKVTPKPPVIDMRGAKVEIKMDTRHLDPDRVAAAVLTGLSRATLRKVQARTSLAYSHGG